MNSERYMSQVKKRILIVDDDFFANPLEASKNFKPDFYDLVILNIKMPKVNGFELYDEFKSKDANTRALFLTALGDVEAYSTQSSKVYPILGERHFAKKPISNNDH